jgi:hypothetical protein
MTSTQIQFCHLGPGGGVHLEAIEVWVMREDQGAVGRQADVNLDHVCHLGGGLDAGQNVVGKPGWPPTVTNYFERVSRNHHYKSIAGL